MNRAIAAVIVAAGRGERAGQSAEGPKQFRRVGDRSVIRRTVDIFRNQPLIERIVLVIHADDKSLLQQALDGQMADLSLVIGGPTRQESVARGLEALAGDPPDIVLIHDAVRPFLDAAIIARILEAIDDQAGAIPATAVADTLKRADAAGRIEATVDRRDLFAAQTPQGFPFSSILKAHRAAATAGRFDFTDDAAIAKFAGLAVKLVEGGADNMKLTTARDILLADERYARQPAVIDVRTGNGYDVHRLVAGDHVTLCGIEIAHDHTLSGHSDADVGLHALTDALLATCGAGDIGDHFPPTDPQWRGAASRIFVERAVEIVRARGGRIMNADVSLICEAPKIAPHREAMCRAIASMTGLTLDRVSVKATTNETIGFVGRREGIAAIATSSVSYGQER